MGLRGSGAKPLKGRESEAQALREVLPWEVEGLSRADRVIAFLEDMPITQGKLAGTKMKIRPWQREFVEAVYREDGEGRRPVRTAVLSMARKNGKTGLAAPLALCHLVGPEAEARAEVYAAANDVKQAGRVFLELVAILDLHPELSAMCNVIRFTKVIEVLHGPARGSVFSVLSSDATTKHGLSPSFCIIDELGQATKRDLFDALNTAMGARDEPLLMVISTQAADDHAPMSELIDYGLKVNAGEVEDPSFHLTLYTTPDQMDPWTLEAWQAANPALGDFRSLDDVKRQAAQAQRVPSLENSFRNLILNQRVASHSRFIAKAEWDTCNALPDLRSLRGRKCFGGLDLSAGRDLTALVLVFPDEEGRFDVLCRFFLPAAGIREKAEADRVPWDVWADKGHLTLIPGSTIDPGFVADVLAQLAAEFQIEALAYDRWRINDLRRELGLIGADLPLVEYGQGFRDMAPAIDRLERAVAEGQLRHGGNPILNMCAGNAVIERDPAGNRKLSKAKASGRIDGLVALAMALAIAGRHEPEQLPACLLELMGIG